MKFLYHIFLILFLISCTEKTTDIGYDKQIYFPKFSQNFIIQGNDNSNDILISVFNPWQGASGVSSRVLVVRDSVAPENFEGQILNDKANRIVCMSSTHIAMLEELDALNKIVGVSGKQYISNSKLQASSQFIVDVGYEGNMDYEALLAVQPDLILLFSVNGASSMEPKLKELGIPFLYIGDYVEEDPLGKAEWIIPIAEVIGEREKGILKFNEIVSRYNNVKSLVDNLDNSEISTNPKVMVNAPFADSWFMPSSKSYVARMIKDAGGDYIYKKNTGTTSLPIDMEEALKLVSEADFWINIGSVNSIEEVKNTFPKFINSLCIIDGRLYNNNKITSPGGGNDCYESGVVNPDLILRDMIKIFYPQLVDEDFVYYQKLQ